MSHLDGESFEKQWNRKAPAPNVVPDSERQRSLARARIGLGAGDEEGENVFSGVQWDQNPGRIARPRDVVMQEEYEEDQNKTHKG